MTSVVAGFYRQGRVELLERPEGLREGRVRVVLIEEHDREAASQHLRFGKYRGGPETTLEDFATAEWHPESRFGDLGAE